MKLDQITNTELSILQVLWRRGEATSKDIADVLYEEVTAPKLASSQKLVERLEAKGCVQRDRSQRAHRYRPLVSQEEYLRNRLKSLADRLCDGAITPLVTALLRTKGLPRKQREELRKVIDDLWPSK
ncbi:MAG: BlaI/MecI/CopY family transcriptional regulator [Thermoguttaceae bacterium]|jgi:predicted transcriptional regulator